MLLPGVLLAVLQLTWVLLAGCCSFLGYYGRCCSFLRHSGRCCSFLMHSIGFSWVAGDSTQGRMSSWRNYSRKKLLKKGVRKENVRIAGSGRLEELVRFIWHNGTAQFYSALGFSPTSEIQEKCVEFEELKHLERKVVGSGLSWLLFLSWIGSANFHRFCLSLG